jgi:hypothetical protein
MTVISDSPFTRAAPVAASRVARAAAVGALVGAVVIGSAISASAHVGVHPDVTAAATGASATPAASIQASGLNAPAVTTLDNTVCVLGGVALLVALVAGGLVLLWRRPQTDVK